MEMDVAAHRKWVESELRQSLRALAAPADIQVVTFAPFVCVTCELLEDYENFSRAARSLGLLTQLPMTLHPIDLAISQLTSADTACDQPERLRTSSRWAEVRRAAIASLTTLGWSYAIPAADVPLGDGTWGRRLESEPQ